MYGYDDEGDGSSSLIGDILGAATALGTTAILSNNQPSQLTPYPAPYNSQGYTGQNFSNASGGSFSMLLVIVLLIAGFFAFKKLA